MEDLLQGNQDLHEMEERRRFRDIVLEKQIIKGIKYCTLSEEDIQNISEVYVSKAFDYDRLGETPIMNGLYDPHMGPANETLICLTCYGNFENCQGHYGCIQLIKPVYHVGYFTTIEGILKCICKACSRILLTDDRCTNYLKKMKGGTIKKDPNGLSFLHHNDTILYPSMALLLLTKMVDKDLELLYVAEKPEKLFISRIAVPPLAVRPSVPLNLRLEGKEYDLTERLKKIIKANESLLKQTDMNSNKYKVSSESLPQNCIGCNNLCTPKNGEILVALNQDFLTSSFLITRKDNFYDRSEFQRIWPYFSCLYTKPEAAIQKPVELWSGKQLFSILLCSHKNVNLTVREKFYSTNHDDRNRELKTMCPNDGFVYFHNSELISGQLGKATLGDGNKDGLFCVLLNDYKAGAAACCINRLSKFSAQWIDGFSIAIHDVEPQNTLINAKDAMIRNSYQTCEESMEIFYKMRQDDNTGRIAAQSLETKITDELNDIRGVLGEVCMETLHWRNSLLIMSQSGSKGSPNNISQIVASVGQQLVGGCRAAIGFTDRCLPHFPKQARNPAAKGFVANSFYSGLSATEFFFHAMGVREGVPISVNIEDTRLVTRRLMKALEDLFSHYDCTVRNTSGDIVQFCYGDDGMDPVSMEAKNGKPLNFERLFLSSKAMYPKDRDEAALSSSDLCEVVRKEFSELCMSNLVESGFSEDLKNFIRGMSGITRRQLEVFVDTCVSRYPSKLIEAGTPVGAIGALSIGEPVGQMTLETFRFAGDATMISTCGVARIKEILSGQRRISTPIITTILERDDNKNIAEEVKRCIEGKTSVQGIATVKRVVICKDPKVDRFMLLLEGTGLGRVMRLEGVNASRTVSNNIMEVFHILGIEAARSCIVDQIRLTMRNQGMRIDMRHILLVADQMTARGIVLGTTDAGFQKSGKSVLTLASIDRAPEYLFDACVHGRDDPVEGVTDCIIMGRPIQIGTGMVNVLQRHVLGPVQARLHEGPIHRLMDEFRAG